MEENRRPFQGVINILSFNRHFYFIGFSILCALLVSRMFIDSSGFVFWLIIAALLYGLIMPLIISAYVYDYSGYYSFGWLNPIIKDREEKKSIVSIHAGFDETSFIIKKRFPLSDLIVFDFYDPERHTEPAIKRARRVSWKYPDTQQMASNTIPLSNHSADFIFLLSSVHEIRSHKEKIEFLKECRRICKPEGKVVMVEHLRDFPNFLAFSVGFTHFFSRSTWKNAFECAGFGSFEERKFTPFMSVFTCSS